MFSGFQTPCLILDRKKFDRNIQKLVSVTKDRDLVVRPHLKTAKSRDVARISASVFGPQATVSTVKEIEQLSGCGITDFLYAVSIVPRKLDRIAVLLNTGCKITVTVENEKTAADLSRYCRDADVRIPAVIELDLDGHRAGVSPSDHVKLCAIGEILHEAGLLSGVMSHAGESYGLSNAQAILECADDEAVRTLNAAETLRKAGFECKVVSIGSTPTALAGRAHDGITELRAGVFMFFDLVQAGVGICRVSDIALSVLTSVISKNLDTGAILVDAGWMALSRDRGTANQAVDYGYGQVCLEDGTVLEDVIVTGAQQEHGIIQVREGCAAKLPDVEAGDLLRVLPNHACATAAAHDRYHVISDRDRDIEIWERFGGW